jgi:hypothetical protein
LDWLRSRVIVGVAVAVLGGPGAAVARPAPAPPAHAFGTWAHDGASDGPSGCVCHDNGTPTDATCTSCHTGYKSVPGQTCWSCHYPGQDTSTLSTPSSACSQECHLYSAADKGYTIAFTHGTKPHVGSTSNCLDCHETSPTVTDPGGSPHHSGSTTGFGDCRSCHSSYHNHNGKVTCTKCHRSAVAFHTYEASSPGYRNCASCHKMKHDKRRVPKSKCSICHKGTGSGPAANAQHSTKITKKRVCSACHRQKLHASSVSSRVKSCRTCHKGKFHARQRIPGNSTCLRCHSSARRHADGYACVLCHKRAVHTTRPRG